ncbi:MAG: ATP-binding protein [Desulfovibrio sp.]|uniref:ATP-binding protein n=1 Tax=Desulfovibrio sp. 7SRBS1 TaxID=3378064 RepID=UPI003B3DFF1E
MKRYSIKFILLGILVILQCLAVGFIQISSYVTSEKALLGNAHSLMENISTFIVSESQNYLSPARDASRLTQRLASSQIVTSHNSKAMERYFLEQLALHPEFAGLYYGSSSGEFLYVMRNDEKIKGGFRTKIITLVDGVRQTRLIWRDAWRTELMHTVDPNDTYDPRVRPWFQRAEKTAHTIWTAPYIFFTSRKPGLTTATPVFGQEGKLMGVVGVDIEIDAISDFLADLQIGEHGKAFILSQAGEVIAFPDISVIARKQADTDNFQLVNITRLDDPTARQAYKTAFGRRGIADLGGKEFTSFELDGKTYYAMFSRFNSPQWPWVIGMYVPEDDVLGPIKRNRNFNLTLATGILLVTMLIGIAMANRIAKAMVALRDEAKAVESYDLDTEFDIDCPVREIQETADSFRKMKLGLGRYRDNNQRLTQGLQHQTEELREKEIRLRDTLASLASHSDAIVVLDPRLRIRFMNPAAERLLEMRADKADGKDFPYAVHKGRVAELELPGDNGMLLVEMHVADTTWDGQDALLVFLRDVTEQRNAERQLKKGNEALAAMVDQLNVRKDQLKSVSREADAACKAAKSANRSKSAFLARMSHEIRTPVNTILGMSELLDDQDMPQNARKYLGAMRSSCDLLLGIVNDILDFTRIEAGQVVLESICYNLSHELEATRRLFEHSARVKGIDLYCEIAPDVPRQVVGDPVRFRQIMANLVGNAVKFTKTGGVVISVERMGQEQSAVVLTFRVSDTGLGVPAEKLATIFDAFSQADPSMVRKHGGSGLGLSIVKSLTSLMHGEITAQSDTHNGSTFSLTIPFETPVMGLPNKSLSSATDDYADRLPQATIIFAEDMAANRDLIELYLKETPVTPLFAENGREALDIFSKTNVDMVFMDIQMPEMDGFEATRRMRRLERKHGRSAVPIIALTAHVFKEHREEALEAGCSGFLGKPVRRQTLFETIAEYCRRDDTASVKKSAPLRGPESEVLTDELLEEELMDLMPSFFESVDRELAAVRVAMANAQKDETERILHGLKGASLSYGFNKLSHLFEVARARCRTGASLQTAFQEIESRLTDLKKRYL